MLIAGLLHTVMGLFLSLFSVFIILLILVQRGRGGGLAGALGGMGGASAFGTKAGDNFTKVTIVAASAWILICILSLKMLSSTSVNRFATGQGAVPPATSGQTTGAPKGETDTGQADTATGAAVDGEAGSQETPPGNSGTATGPPAESAPAGTPASSNSEAATDGSGS